MSRRRLCAGGFLTLIAFTLFPASAAGAHGTSGPPASNFTTELGVQGLGPGVTIRLGSDHESLVVEVSGNHRVTISGYGGEPYLRVDRRGVFENRSSPAVALNRSRIPAGIARGVSQNPSWRRLSSGSVVRWHDHRTHWMGGATPDVVRRDPDHHHVIDRWTIPVRVDGRVTAITGRLRWSPPPSAWPWWTLAAGLATAVLALTSARGGRCAVGVLAPTVGVMTVAESVHVWASWPFSFASTGGRVGEASPSIAAIGMSSVALIWLLRRGAWSAAPGVLLAGLFVFVSGGLADVSALSHSFVPSRLSADWARAIVAVALGLGLGTALSGARRLRAARPQS